MESKRIRLPKLKWIAMKKHREPAEDFRLKSVTVSMEPSGKYFASLLYEGYSCENQAAEPDYSTAKMLGIDYAMQGMAVFSEKIETEEAGFFRKNEKRLAREQRKLSRCVRGSHNYESEPELTSVDSKLNVLCKTTVDHMISLLEKQEEIEKNVVVPCEIVKRCTTDF
ncbi:transposase [Mediterraneibacter faecis]|uniref:transposase n=1 Tax=Mediterraneibacter faecis TaxID=592978 RepID=UPI003F7100F9